MKNQFPKVHPDLQRIIRMGPKFTVSKNNHGFFRFLTSLMPGQKPPEGIHIENIFIKNQDDQKKLRLRTYKPKSSPISTPALLWLHGGGQVMGKPEMNDFDCIHFVSELGITVVSVDYRLAPKHPFPAGLEDSYTALKWMAESDQLNINPTRIAIGGASAGGGLAAALAQLAHDRKEIKLIFQLLIYPMLDDRTVLRTEIDDSNSPTWTQRSNRFGWESYLGGECGAKDVPAYAVPARREDLSDLPPAWIGVGTLDVFHDEDVAYAQRLKEQGVECEIKIVPGAFHGFDVFDHTIPLVQDFQKAQIAALKKYLFV